MNIDLGWLGKVVLESIDAVAVPASGFVVVADGYTETGIRVHGVLDERAYRVYPTVWQNAILIKL